MKYKVSLNEIRTFSLKCVLLHNKSGFMVILEGKVIYGGKKYDVILHDKEKKGKNLYRISVDGIGSVLEKNKDKWSAKGIDAGLCEKIGHMI